MTNFRVSDLDTVFSMLFNLLRFEKAIFQCLFFLLIIFRNILRTSLLIRDTILKLAQAFPTGIPMAVVKELREAPLLAPDRTNWSEKRLVSIAKSSDIFSEYFAHFISVFDFRNTEC